MHTAARNSLSLRYSADGLWLLDQTALPLVERWVEASAPEQMIGHIRALRVRGAPAIGVAAALCLAASARRGMDPGSLRSAAQALRAARPTAVNLMWAIDRMGPRLSQGASAIEQEAVDIFDEDLALCETMAGQGLPLISDGEQLLTHCNTGGLATAGVGTALGLIRRAWEAGRQLHVWVDETRPLLQGARLTAWELQRLGIPHTLISDSMAGLLLRDGRVQRVLVGADRIAANGDFANKVGTYSLFALAHLHGVPTHAVAPWSTVDLSTPTGAQIPIEERDGDELRGGPGARWAPPQSPTWNPAFDVTPSQLLTSLILDRGVYSRQELSEGALLRVGAERCPPPARPSGR